MRLRGAIVGFIEIDGRRKVYISRRTMQHQFHMFGNGFGISKRILDYLKNEGVNEIIIVFERVKLQTNVQKFYEKGQSYVDGGDEQLILTLSEFDEGGVFE